MLTIRDNTKRLDVFLVAGATVIILFAIAISASLQGPDAEPFSKVITVGPVWGAGGDSWTCVSDSDFMLHGTLRGLGNSQLTISIQGVGTQSLYTFNPGEMETFSVGNTAGKNVILTRTGTLTGFITLQTAADATASCTQP